MQQAASNTGSLSGAFVLAPMEQDGTWKGERLREESRACRVGYPAYSLWQHACKSTHHTRVILLERAHNTRVIGARVETAEAGDDTDSFPLPIPALPSSPLNTLTEG